MNEDHPTHRFIGGPWDGQQHNSGGISPEHIRVVGRDRACYVLRSGSGSTHRNYHWRPQ